MLETLTPTQRQRTDTAITQLRIQWAKLYGDRLPSLVTEHLAVEAALHPEIIDAAHGLGPQSEEVFRLVAQELVDAQPLAQRALDSADENLKSEIRAAKLAEMPATLKMQMAREKSIDAHLNQAVAEELERRHDLRQE